MYKKLCTPNICNKNVYMNQFVRGNSSQQRGPNIPKKKRSLGQEIKKSKN